MAHVNKTVQPQQLSNINKKVQFAHGVAFCLLLTSAAGGRGPQERVTHGTLSIVPP